MRKAQEGRRERVVMLYMVICVRRRLYVHQHYETTPTQDTDRTSFIHSFLSVSGWKLNKRSV